jgi:hypothetical protein
MKTADGLKLYCTESQNNSCIFGKSMALCEVPLLTDPTEAALLPQTITCHPFQDCPQRLAPMYTVINSSTLMCIPDSSGMSVGKWKKTSHPQTNKHLLQTDLREGEHLKKMGSIHGTQIMYETTTQYPVLQQPSSEHDGLIVCG